MFNRHNRRRAAAASVAAVAISIAGVAIASGVSAAEAGRFTPDDLPKIVRISDPQVSPDGAGVAVIIARANLKEDRYDTELALVDVAAKQVRVLTHDRLGVSSPRWSPGGDRIAFVAEDAAKTAQLYVLPLNGGDPDPADPFEDRRHPLRLAARRRRPGLRRGGRGARTQGRGEVRGRLRGRRQRLSRARPVTIGAPVDGRRRRRRSQAPDEGRLVAAEDAWREPGPLAAGLDRGRAGRDLRPEPPRR